MSRPYWKLDEFGLVRNRIIHTRHQICWRWDPGPGPASPNRGPSSVFPCHICSHLSCTALAMMKHVMRGLLWSALVIVWADGGRVPLSIVYYIYIFCQNIGRSALVCMFVWEMNWGWTWKTLKLLSELSWACCLDVVLAHATAAAEQAARVRVSIIILSYWWAS